jgi:hypothetical protein
VDAGVAAFATFPVAFLGVALGVALGVSASFFLTGSVRLGLFEVAKKSEVVVSSSSGSGEGSRFAFLGGGFFCVVFSGLHVVSLMPRRCLGLVMLTLPAPPHLRQSRQRHGLLDLTSWGLLSLLEVSSQF